MDGDDGHRSEDEELARRPQCRRQATILLANLIAQLDGAAYVARVR